MPLYGGFMYAAVGSYVCRSWRLLDLALTGYRARVTAVLAAGVHLNFLTRPWLLDVRWLLGGLLPAATAGVRVHFTVGAHRHRMPLALSFVLIGFFLWLAENIATYFGAWRYPYQLHGWEPVSRFQMDLLGPADQRHLRHLPGPSPRPARRSRGRPAAEPDPRSRLRGPGLGAGQARGLAAGGRRPDSKA